MKAIALFAALALTSTAAMADSVYVQQDTNGVSEIGGTFSLNDDGIFVYGGLDTSGWMAGGIGANIEFTDNLTVTPYAEYGVFDGGKEQIVEVSASYTLTSKLAVNGAVGYKYTKFDRVDGYTPTAFGDYDYPEFCKDPGNNGWVDCGYAPEGDPTLPALPDQPIGGEGSTFVTGTDMDTRKASAGASYQMTNSLTIDYVFTHEHNFLETNTNYADGRTGETVSSEFRTNEHEVIATLGHGTKGVAPYVKVSHFTVNGDSSDTTGTAGINFAF